MQMHADSQLTSDQEMPNVMVASRSCQVGLAMPLMQHETVLFVCLLHLAPLHLRALLLQLLLLEQAGPCFAQHCKVIPGVNEVYVCLQLRCNMSKTCI